MRWLVPVLLVACATPESDDITGPFTGPVYRFVVDDFTLPLTTTHARELAEDLDGDNRGDNHLGASLSALSSNDNLTLHGTSMIAAGVIASFVEVQADSLVDDPTVSVRYIGRDGEPGVHVGGSIENGVFRSNRTHETRVPGKATLHLPVFADADPSVVVLEGMQMDLFADGNDGGYRARIQGGVGMDVFDETARGLVQMIDANPQGHPFATLLLDENRDGKVTHEEVRENALIQSLLAFDIDLRIDGERVPRASFGFSVHLRPCADGNCALGTPAEPCFDRVLDGDESGVDCGGSCIPCAGGATCRAPSDCQSQTCSSGVCAPPSCSDGVLSGYETDVDCGWNCAGCANGMRCRSNADCASERCGDNRVCW